MQEGTSSDIEQEQVDNDQPNQRNTFKEDENLHERMLSLQEELRQLKSEKGKKNIPSVIKKTSPKTKKPIKVQTAETVDPISNKSKKISVTRKVLPSFADPSIKQARKIISVSYPFNFVGNGKNKTARFCVDIKYIGQDNKPHYKQVRFGDKNRQEYFETGDETARLRKVNSQRKELNILYPNYWNYLYLNHHSGNLDVAFNEILRANKLHVK